MSDLVFNEEDLAPKPVPTAARSSFTAYLVRWGIAKDERQASVILVGASLFLITAAVVVAFSGSSSGLEPVTTPPTSNVINPAIVR